MLMEWGIAPEVSETYTTKIEVTSIVTEQTFTKNVGFNIVK